MLNKNVIFILITAVLTTVIIIGICKGSLCGLEIGGFGLTFKAQLAYES